MRFANEVSEDDCSSEGRDIAAAIPVHGGHLPFDRLLLRCQQACFRFLHELSGFDRGLMTPHIDADLHRAVGPGRIQIGVTVERIGHAAFTLHCEVRQHDMLAAVARLVLVTYDYERAAALPLSPSQRDALAAHQWAGLNR